MSLRNATFPDGQPIGLPSTPVPCDELFTLFERRFQLPCDDPWLEDPSGPGATYLQAALGAWDEHPEWMDFLDQHSPAWDLKRAARDLYLEVLEPFLAEGGTALDVGCGIGRMLQPLLDRGYTVHGVDGDHQSLERCAWHAAGRAGALELHWSTPRHLPDVQVDLALAVESLCYLEDPQAALDAMVQRVRPGGHVFVAMEARWGWAASEDAPPEGLEAALGASVLEVPGDRYVQLFDRERMESWIAAAGLELEVLVPTHYLTDGPLEALLPLSCSREELVALESRFRAHPIWGPLNRIWTAVARRP